MIKYNFDEIIPREGTNCLKYDAREAIFHTNDVLPLWVADTDFRVPNFITQALKKRLAHEIYGYSCKPVSYYEAIVGWMKRRHNWQIEKEWISFSPGVVSGLTLSIKTFSQPGDEVVVMPPVYPPFFDCITGTKRKIIETPLLHKNGKYHFNLKDLETKISEKTKLLLLCNPQNPGGRVWSKSELEELSHFCHENNIMVISDEIHSDLIYKGNQQYPFASVSEEAANNSIVLMAPSKTFNIAGLSTSVVIAPNKSIFDKYEKTLEIEHLCMGNIFGTVALEAAYDHGDEWLDQLMDYLWNNYLFLENFMNKNLPKIKVMKPESTFLAWLDFSEYGMKDRELTDFLITKAKVGLNNGAQFGTGGEGWMRLNIGCPRSILTKALIQIKNAFDNL